MAAAQHVTVQTQPITTDQKHAYRVIRILGTANIITGLFTLVFGIVVTAKHEEGSELQFWVSEIGFGIWTGAWILVTGILGMLGGKKKSIPLIAISMAFNICSSVVCALNMIFFGVAISYYRDYIPRGGFSQCWRTRGHYYDGYYDKKCIRDIQTEGRVFTAMYALLIILAMTDFIISIISSAYSCKTSLCMCCLGTPNQMVVYTADGAMTLVPVNSSGNFVIPMSRAGPPGAYPQQVWTSSANTMGPVTSVTNTQGMQSSVVNVPPTMTNTVPTVPGAAGGLPEAPPSYTEKAPLPPVE